MVFMTDSREDALSPTARDIVEGIDAFNEKVTDMRAKFEADPDDAIDKMMKVVFPAAAGFVASKALEMMWNHGTPKHAPKIGVVRGMVNSAVFAGLSAAVGAMVSQASEHGSQALVNRRHRRNR
ncbi:DUF4235 domain-containing protein [Bifidobacterium sp. SMB2]|uniref:DUF4235 domain-containing protein n=2 Tax=Bifidobacterium TaxID=1678 RepID=A0ABX0CD10_9BIFI|nr:DUF4235 domain-containing protein [Bifidobacterium sp. SMB2]NEH12556.1 DUF4235 domain-containing protein [Bifidobacterium saimiriisciurei]